jgi:hypothetical protein
VGKGISKVKQAYDLLQPNAFVAEFPSPCGEAYFKSSLLLVQLLRRYCFHPLAGKRISKDCQGDRGGEREHSGSVSIPLRGSVFQKDAHSRSVKLPKRCFHPLAGKRISKAFSMASIRHQIARVSTPLRGSVFQKGMYEVLSSNFSKTFPSPCGEAYFKRASSSRLPGARVSSFHPLAGKRISKAVTQIQNSNIGILFPSPCGEAYFKRVSFQIVDPIGASNP